MENALIPADSDLAMKMTNGMGALEQVWLRLEVQDGTIPDKQMVNLGAGSVDIMSLMLSAFYPMQILALSLEFCCLQVPSLRASWTWRSALETALWRPSLAVPLCMWATSAPLPAPPLQEAGFLLVAGRQRAATSSFLGGRSALRHWSAISRAPLRALALPQPCPSSWAVAINPGRKLSPVHTTLNLQGAA